LSFELFLAGRRLIVNGGTSLYENGRERARQRGTAAHSTLVVDGHDSSETWGSFRVARRARPFDLSSCARADGLHLTCSHDGFRRLKGKPIHSRSWSLNESSLAIADTLTGGGIHRSEINFHFGPGCLPIPAGDGRWHVVDEKTRGILATAITEGSVEASIHPTTYHPEFGISVASWVLRTIVEGALPHKCNTIIQWDLA
jgi:Heparinase II/III-like protein